MPGRDCPVLVPQFLLCRTKKWDSVGVTVFKQADKGEQGPSDTPSADLGLTHPLQKQARVPSSLSWGPGLLLASSARKQKRLSVVLHPSYGFSGP